MDSCPEFGKDPRMMKTFLYQTICGIFDCHSQRVLHRDLKLTKVFAAKFQGIARPTSVHATLAHGLLVKPSFQKFMVHYGMNVLLSSSQYELSNFTSIKIYYFYV